MADGTTKSVKNVQVGDAVRSPVIPVALNQKSTGPIEQWTVQHVTKVLKTNVEGTMPMVDYQGMSITQGHPMYINGDWYRPDELFTVDHRYVEEIYNFVLDGEHAFVVNNVICCTVGRDCGQRLRLKCPHQDKKYGKNALTTDKPIYAVPYEQDTFV